MTGSSASPPEPSAPPVDSPFSAPPHEANTPTSDTTETMSRIPTGIKLPDAVANIDTAQVAAKVESFKKWTIGTFKNSKQQLLEHMGKIDKTVDPEFEAQCEVLKDIHRRYGLVVAAAKNFSQVLTQMAEAEKKLSESFYQLSLKEEQIKAQCTTTSETMRGVGEQASSLDACLRYFISSMETVYSQTITDTLHTIYNTESARIEYDVDRNDITAASNPPQGQQPKSLPAGATEKCDEKKAKYEKLKSDARIKMRLLEENRISVVAAQLEKLQSALAAYYSGNAKLLESSVRELSILQTPQPSFIPAM
ncbi:hypothetical protein CRE_25307 [Caenorhabditis remanei]|uniref:AH domain-containing protein n=1 Tax=Caenorhabditis remanei TaxID=31234 RepID=E3LSG2_CAERE|nr:hypothetical protein CRE_25307 [Caenorhabditis remanei]